MRYEETAQRSSIVSNNLYDKYQALHKTCTASANDLSSTQTSMAKIKIYRENLGYKQLMQTTSKQEQELRQPKCLDPR